MDLLCHHIVCCSRSWKINSFKETTWIIITHMMCVLSDPHCIRKINIWYLSAAVFPQLRLSSRGHTVKANNDQKALAIRLCSQDSQRIMFCFLFLKLPVCVFVLARRSKPHHSQPRFAAHVCILHKIHLCLRVCLCRKKRQKMRRCSVCTSRDTWERKMLLAARNGEQLIGFHHRCEGKGVRRAASSRIGSLLTN